MLTLVSKIRQIGSKCSNLVILLAREVAGVHLHALQTVTEQFKLCKWGNEVLENCFVTLK